MNSHTGFSKIIQIYDSLEELSRAAADLFLQIALTAVRQKGLFSVALSGGQTPRCLYEILARPPYRETIPWTRTHLFWGDERCVPKDDPRNNAGNAIKLFIEHVSIPDDQTHRMACDESPRQFARNYEGLLRNYFGDSKHSFDLTLLGLGTDGHTASLFPGSPACQENEVWVREFYSERESIYRLTLTPPILNRSANIVFLVSQGEKAKILKDILEGTSSMHQIPASAIRSESGRTMWFTDRQAAALLDPKRLRSSRIEYVEFQEKDKSASDSSSTVRI
jgi:6-phosphogluconolactonase